ncbi:hypothetical protein A6M27_17130 [Acidithiobacillus thiooxidans]|uniref:Uncharacterized protein n=1 Tax=Acidithiobacillus thiooxidans TaxID=930 RepID=A0A1C2J669_ACITH|nr:hypothetical protein [Acidithiobacillus thiooxidans]OCX67714.1 hypothetical protein A6M23_19995 [Acidithiobacillus thiooxidans]OCX69565.1 hypothetical protein A6P07_16200 [Acidithiobacillus thiooxidans]OCX69775.1 hypothetical protein A6O24_17690 [Acidithiobacillus thiooxidans]OCX79636.1 hypothetical protein A6O26_16180 [Acidithiobacillus thiooxidans]OCX81358.1 hypothetical protein A6P08_13890 [Acidithiobacillus thiooxidans]
MAKHIKLTSKNNSVVIIDINRILSCESLDLFTDEYRAIKLRWDFLSRKSMFGDNYGEWLLENPKPNPEDYLTGEKTTILSMANKTTIEVKESCEEIFSEIKKSLGE